VNVHGRSLSGFGAGQLSGLSRLGRPSGRSLSLPPGNGITFPSEAPPVPGDGLGIGAGGRGKGRACKPRGSINRIGLPVT